MIQWKCLILISSGQGSTEKESSPSRDWFDSEDDSDEFEWDSVDDSEEEEESLPAHPPAEKRRVPIKECPVKEKKLRQVTLDQFFREFRPVSFHSSLDPSAGAFSRISLAVVMTQVWFRVSPRREMGRASVAIARTRKARMILYQ